MIDVKVSVSIVIPGTTMYTEEESSKNPSLLAKNTLVYTTGKGSNTHKESITYFTRKTKPAVFRTNISLPSYKAMIGDYAPSGINPKEWKRLSNKNKLEYHLKLLCEEMGGTSISYDIFED